MLRRRFTNVALRATGASFRCNATDAAAAPNRVDCMKLAYMVRSFENHGHLEATTDPLGLAAPASHWGGQEPFLGLEPKAFGFTDADMEKTFNVAFDPSSGGTFTSGTTPMKLKDIYARLREVYSGDIGFEFMACGAGEVRSWFRNEIMSSLNGISAKDKKDAFESLVSACGFESFLAKKFGTVKRFGADGGEALIPSLQFILDECATLGANRAVIGMPHRGRLSVLHNVAGKSLERIFNEFDGKTHKDETLGTFDVKYHLGAKNVMPTFTEKKIEVEVVPNPSHLETVAPVATGLVRHYQVQEKDEAKTGNVCIALHGDASVAGQGVVYETAAMSRLQNFDIGGTIHIVVNNQVGFTADPHQSRATRYCTDLAMCIKAPVLHVNGDSIDQVVRASRIAARYRQQFNADVIIDLVCYRRYGHNESDVPMFTQPILYKTVTKAPHIVDKYGAQLAEAGVLSAEQVKASKDGFEEKMKAAMAAAAEDPDFIKIKDSVGQGPAPTKIVGAKTTGVPTAELRAIGEKITTIPEGFKMHPNAERPVKARREAIAKEDGLEYCFAEGLAFGSLATEGFNVRLTGEDVQRGTFSQRHAVLTDNNTGAKHMPMGHISPTQGNITIENSALTEYGCCGYEAGYALGNTDTLVMWEAQFGDFANGAQIVFDQYISSTEQKWFIESPIVISLPHGYDGQGPEHSSSRIERFLQSTDDAATVPADFNLKAEGQELLDLAETRIKAANWQVCYTTRPSNYFHVLRRQMTRTFRKPLIHAFAKSGVRAPNLSPLAEMGEGTSFRHVIESTTGDVPTANVRKVIMCTGHIERKLKAMLEAQRKATGNPDLHNDIKFAVCEQIAPFPWEHLGKVVEAHKAANPNVELVWLQEEPKNMGCWQYVRPRINNLVQHITGDKSFRVPYIGRHAQASPSTGYETVHAAEEKQLYDSAFQ